MTDKNKNKNPLYYNVLIAVILHFINNYYR